MATKKRILIVDDERDLVETMTFRLEASGYEILKAYDGQEGLKKIREEKPDLVLLDVMMPLKDGYQVCQEVKNDEKIRNIPVIMLTAKSQESDKSVGESVGVDDYLTKPFQSHELLEKIEKFLK